MCPFYLNLGAVQISAVTDAVAFGPAMIECIAVGVKKRCANKETIVDMPWFVDKTSENER